MKKVFLLSFISFCFGFTGLVLWAGSAHAQPFPIPPVGGLPVCQADLQACQAQLKCGDGVVEEIEDCDVGNLNGATCITEGFLGGILACATGCTFDTSGCFATRFVDNSDGTVTDNQTGLMWEKKVAGSSGSFDSQGVGDCLHCVGDKYFWNTEMSEWISAVNGRTDDSDGSDQSGLGGYTDWRIPTQAELLTILLEPFPCSTSPCINPIFGPTADDPSDSFYWSSTTAASSPNGAWGIVFDDGFLGFGFKPFFNSVAHFRAVRYAP